MRRGTGTTLASPVAYLHSDPLSSVSAITSSSGAVLSETRYDPFGVVRWASGTTVTDLGYTGQRANSTGLMDYNARFYSPYLTQFTQPDTIIQDPYNPLDWNRFAYARFNPIRYNDPTGYDVDCGAGEAGDPGCHARVKNEKYWLPSYLVADVDTDGKVENWEAEKIFLSMMADPGDGLQISPKKFGDFNTLGGPGYHPGVDIYGSLGINTPIQSIANGKVVGVYNTPDDRVNDGNHDFGLHVIVEHDVYGIKLYSVYAHLDRTNAYVGQSVTNNSIIGYMGNTPFEPGGTIHLHFEVRTATNVNLTNPENARVRGMDFWIDSKEEFLSCWVNLGLYYGYSRNFPREYR